MDAGPPSNLAFRLIARPPGAAAGSCRPRSHTLSARGLRAPPAARADLAATCHHPEEFRRRRTDVATPLKLTRPLRRSARNLHVPRQTLDHERGCQREEAARAASGRRGDPDIIGMTSRSLRPACVGPRDNRTLERDFLDRREAVSARTTTLTQQHGFFAATRRHREESRGRRGDTTISRRLFTLYRGSTRCKFTLIRLAG